MARSKRGGKASVSGYQRYKSGNVESANRTRKLTKLAIEQPNNEQIPLAIKNIRHRRFTPKTPYWSNSMIRIARVVKSFTGKFNRNYFSTDLDSKLLKLRVLCSLWGSVLDGNSNVVCAICGNYVTSINV